MIHEIYSNSYKFSFGTTKSLYHFFIAEITDGNNPFTLFIFPSNHNSPKKRNFGISEIWASFHSFIKTKIATAIGKSKLVQTFFMSDGDKFKTNLRFGNSMPALRNVDLKRSFDSLIAVSGSQIISIFGNDLFKSASTKISYHCNQMFVKVFVVHTISNNITNKIPSS